MDAFDPVHALVRVRPVDESGQVVRAFLQIQDVGFFRFVKGDASVKSQAAIFSSNG